jgi:hypothetical protein
MNADVILQALTDRQTLISLHRLDAFFLTARPNPPLIPTVLLCRDFFRYALGTLRGPINAAGDSSPSTAAMLSPVVDW